MLGLTTDQQAFLLKSGISFVLLVLIIARPWLAEKKRRLQALIHAPYEPG